MTCQELIDFLMAYLDGELPAEVRRTFEEHLALCPDCRAYLSSYRAAISLGKNALASSPAQADPAPLVPEALIQAILAAGKAQQANSSQPD